jgi:hypothetical protein
MERAMGYVEISNRSHQLVMLQPTFRTQVLRLQKIELYKAASFTLIIHSAAIMTKATT